MPPFTFNRLIITDTKNRDAAKDFKKNQWPDATIIEVQTVAEFVAELQQSRSVGALSLLLDGDEIGRIEINGKPLEMSDLAGVGMTVIDTVTLEGVAGKPFKAPATLKAKLQAQAVIDNWLLELPRPVVVVEDQETHEIASTVGSDGLGHFVTVRQASGHVLLRAKLVSGDTPENRAALKWTWLGRGRYGVKGDPLALRISRGSTKKVQLSLIFKGMVVRQIVVWVVWCKLTPLKTLTSPLDPPDMLGCLQTRVESPAPNPALEVFGSVDWLMTTEPPEVITDADRPDLPTQTPRLVPGESVIPDANTFCGWEHATDVRTLIASITPAGDHVLVSKDDYAWPNGDTEGVSLAKKQKDPYTEMFPGWPSRWAFAFEDSDGAVGEIRGFHRQARLFVRVQLDATWYRCSTIKRYRYRDSAKFLSSGKWDPEPGTKPLLEMNNSNWGR